MSRKSNVFSKFSRKLKTFHLGFVGLKSCVLAAAVAGGALAYLAHYWISRRKLNDKPPKR